MNRYKIKSEWGSPIGTIKSINGQKCIVELNKMPNKLCKYEEQINLICKALYIDVPIPEYQFLKTRKWRFDFAWTLEKVAIEVHGGTWVAGMGHTRGSGFARDREKINAAIVHGWKVFEVLPAQLNNGYLQELLATYFMSKHFLDS